MVYIYRCGFCNKKCNVVFLFLVVGVGKTCAGSGNESRGSGRKSE